MSQSEFSNEIVRGLLEPAAYPWNPDAVRLIETHISWVFLAGPFVVKVKRPVHFDFIDHSTIGRRHASCLEEVRLNRRLTEGVYLDVLPISRATEGIRVGGEGEVIDWATLMRRLPADAMLDCVLDRGAPLTGVASRIADVLIPFHSAEAPPCEGSSDEIYEFTMAIIRENLQEIRRIADDALPAKTFALIEREMLSFVERNRPGMFRRIADGYVRDGHGDLRCEHICIETDWVQVFDCVEFNQSIRCADIVSDLAFLLMDLERLGQPDLAREIVNRYSEAGIDLPEPLLHFYMAHRALVRAKTGVLAGQSDTVTYLGLALRAIAEVRPVLIIMTGLSGTGKSTVARMVGVVLDAPVFASDEIRKELAGIEGSAHTEWQSGIYSPGWNELTYSRLFELGANVLSEGSPVVLDAAFLSAEHRERAADFARNRGVELVVVETICSEEIVRERLERRSRNASAQSDADFQIYRNQREMLALHSPSIPNGAHHVAIDTAGKPNTWIDPVIQRLVENDVLIVGLPDLP